MKTPKLFMLLLGCRPAGRNTEQHDIFFSIGNSMKDILPDIQNFWPDSGPIHLDAWREITEVDGHKVSIILNSVNASPKKNELNLFFINLGGYKPDAFDEFHYKMLAVAPLQSQAIKQAKETAFYTHTGFKGAESHIDDKFGIDIDDLYLIKDILPSHCKEKYSIEITKDTTMLKDEWHLGYKLLKKLGNQ